MVPGFSFAPFNNLEKLKSKCTKNTAGVIVEIVQGEGGVYPGTKKFLKGVEEFCRKNGILMIVDEIQTGFCRTGKMFAIEHFLLNPDIICLAKAIGGGLPMGAVVCSQKIKVPIGRHGTTFGGNPLVCAAANEVIDQMIDFEL